MKKIIDRLLFPSFFALLIVAFVVQPVAAWTDVGVEYYDDYENTIGYWDEDDNEALEGNPVWSYGLDIWFQINGIDQSADVYKIRIDYDGGDAQNPELMRLWYRWGSSASYTYADDIGPSSEDFQVTITDASSTTLEIRITDSSRFFDAQRDLWFFGGEPELWMYWY